MLINTQNLTSIFTGFKAAFKNGFAGVGTDWDKISTLINSTDESELYAWLGQFPSLRAWVGDRIIKDMKAHDYTVKNEDFESTVSMPRNKVLDDKFGVFSTLFADMGNAAARHPDEVVFALLALGASELCYDGQFFFDTDHPLGATTASNYDATGGGNLWMLLDTTRPIKPMIFQKRAPYDFQSFTDPRDSNVFMNKKFLYGVDTRVNAGFGLWQLAHGSLNTLNGTNFDTYFQAMETLESDEGGKLGVKPNLLVCGPSNRAAARDLISANTLASGASNPHYDIVKVLVTPYLT